MTLRRVELPLVQFRRPPPNEWPSDTATRRDANKIRICLRRYLTRWHYMNLIARFVCGLAVLALPFSTSRAADKDFDELKAQVTKQHDESIKRLQDWIKQVSIAAEDRGYPEGADYMIQLLKDAGFQKAERVETDGKPGVFATLEAGAPKTIGLYFMYDVKQFDPKEWSSPPTEAAIVDKPGVGRIMVGRGAVNQKGPQAAFLAALHAMKAAGKKIPVNFVFVAEGEEEIGSPHFGQVVHKPEVEQALKKCAGIFMPFAAQDLSGMVTVTLGAKGVIEVELTSTGEKWGRGPMKDIHSSNKARVDSPVWHLVQALNTLVTEDGNEPAIEGLTKNVRPLTVQEKEMIETAAKRLKEEDAKKIMGVKKWVKDISWTEALQRMADTPTVNIEGIIGGYTGPGGKTILPHKAIAKLDLRLVPNQTAEGALAALKAHLQKKGYGDIDVNMTGGYDPTTTPPDSPIIQAEEAVYKNHGIDPVLLPRLGGSWPGYVFTNPPLSLGAGHFGLGHGSGAHAPDEYFLIESANPKVSGWDGAVMSYVEYLYELAK
ncbi:M20/M25/M40 family metallo-hydrolase [soil metagenome]